MVITLETPLFQTAELPTQVTLPTRAIFRKACYAPVSDYLYLDETGQCCYGLGSFADPVNEGPEDDEDDDDTDRLDLQSRNQ